MPAPGLVTYASRYGSTQEVAEVITTALRQHGLEVDLYPMREVRSLQGYGAVVLGAPLYIGRWHKNALDFLSRHEAALTGLPVAVFALGPLHDDEKERQGSRAMLENELARFPWLIPVALEIFGGRYDPLKLSFSHRLLAALPASPLHGLPASDVRDWTAIRAWAHHLPMQLQSS